MLEQPSLPELEAAFRALHGVLPTGHPRPPKQFYSWNDLQSAFQALRQPLAIARERGGLINPWALAKLGQNEVRNAASLAGLLMIEFGGETSLRFAAGYLSSAFPDVEWSKELGEGYRVATEVCVLGEIDDRVDLVIETSSYLIGIEVKIRAGLGRNQLERYSSAISLRAELQKLNPLVILLAPFRAKTSAVASTSWSDVSRAALAAAREKVAERTFVQHLIASFGEHARFL